MGQSIGIYGYKKPWLNCQLGDQWSYIPRCTQRDALVADRIDPIVPADENRCGIVTRQYDGPAVQIDRGDVERADHLALSLRIQSV